MTADTTATIPNLETDEQRWFLESHMKDVRELVVNLAYTHGLHTKRGDSFYISPRWHDLAVRWGWYYGCTYLYIDDRELTKHELKVFGRNGTWDYGGRAFEMEIAKYTDDLLEMFLPGIKIKTSIRQCAMPFHFHKYPQFRIDTEPKISLCHMKDERWFCLDCEGQYSLSDTNPVNVGATKRTAANNERAKMTNSLRFEVLNRCDFTCGLCGRSPLRGDDVKLHVDHKIPVSKGGKTEQDNLWVLCQDCNLGKSDKVLGQMALGFQSQQGVTL
jgi:hypothetical protein